LRRRGITTAVLMPLLRAGYTDVIDDLIARVNKEDTDNA
jgi:hypothetical protein